jgi:hypothetical protein
MIEPLNALKQALAYARFEDDSIKKATNNLINELDTELGGEQYEPGTAVEDATSILTTVLDATDSQKEEAVVEVEDEDPFAGLGDEDDEEEEK